MSFAVRVLAVLLFASACFSKEINHCKVKLKNIVSSPESAAKKYLAEIDEQLRLMGPLLFTDQSESVIEAIENTYGVDIEMASPFGVVCNVYRNLRSPTSSSIFPFPTQTGPNGPIISMKVSVDLTISSLSNLQMQLLYFSSDFTSGVNNIPLVNFGTCTSSPGIIGAFEDGGVAIGDNCSNLNDALTFSAMGGSIMESVKTFSVRANTPMYLRGLSSSSQVMMTLRSANLTICAMDPSTLTYDANKANLNVPGFRFDSGVYYYTTVHRDEFGQEKHITISVPISSLTC